MKSFASASWPTSLKISSFLGSALLVAVSVAAAKAIPRGTGVPFAGAVGSIVAFVPPVIVLFASLFIVRSYEVESGSLHIRRLLWSTPIPLTGLHRIYVDPDMMKHSLRIFGNGGLFSITGVYQNAALGRYRAFVTDPRYSIALFLPKGVVVVSPADAEEFVNGLSSLFPGVEVGSPNISGNAD